MNYIKSLENEVKELRKDKRDAMKSFDTVISYLLSSKFNCGDSLDGYVSTKEMISKIGESRYSLNSRPTVVKESN